MVSLNDSSASRSLNVLDDPANTILLFPNILYTYLYYLHSGICSTYVREKTESIHLTDAHPSSFFYMHPIPPDDFYKDSWEPHCNLDLIFHLNLFVGKLQVQIEH